MEESIELPQSTHLNFLLIFAVCLVINVIVTIRSSEWYERRTKRNTAKGNGNASETDSNSISTPPTEETVKSTSESKPQNQDSQPLLPSSETEETVLSQANSGKVHKKLLLRYLCVYLLAAMSDWLQGPYVYALYDAYGFSQHDIAVLFVAGFGSSMVFGSFVGGMADSGGRKRYVMIFCITYALSCLTKHFNDYWILMVGRLLGGIATSLLFSVFESWLVQAHSKKNLDKKYISKSFSMAAYGNSIVAILAGLMANQVASMNHIQLLTTESEGNLVYVGGYLNPFDLSLFALIACGVFGFFLWDENFGDQVQTSSLNCCGDMKRAYETTMRNREILLCGVVSSIFESSMYVFVFMWTPAMTNLTDPDGKGESELPFGLIFSTFMVCCMTGSSLFSIIIGQNYRVETITIGVLFISTICFLIYTFSTSALVTYISMNFFEVCCGVYFPTMGTMKSSIVPESQRSAIYNLYRIPLNFIVLVTLVTHLSIVQSFALCVAMLSISLYLQIELRKRRMGSDPAGKQVQLVATDDEKRKMVSPQVEAV